MKGNSDRTVTGRQICGSLQSDVMLSTNREQVAAVADWVLPTDCVN